MLMPVALCVRARLRMKRRIDRDCFCAESGQHVENDVVVSNANRIAENLYGQMSIAQMPGNPGQMSRAIGPDIDNPFCTRFDPHRAAVAEFQPIAVSQSACFGKVEEKFTPGRCLHRNAPTMPLVEIEFDHVGVRSRLACYRMCDESGHDQYRK